MKSNPTNRRRAVQWLGAGEISALVALVVAVPFIIGRLRKFKRDADAFDRTPAADWFRVRIAATANAPIDRAFEIIVPIDVPSIMPGYGPLPAVTGVENQTGDWDAAGQTRVVRLADDTTAREEMTLYDAPIRFGYTVSDWSGALRFLTNEAKGEWHFSEIAPDQTRISWNYTFAPRSIWTAWLLLAAVQFLWRGAMKQALRECVRQVESGAHSLQS